MTSSPNPRKHQHQAYKLGIIIGLISLAVLLLPAYANFHARGPMNNGHDTIKCESCHQEAPGSFRQQIQANVRFALGLRKHSSAFDHQPVSNENCLSCHERPNDRHPVYRFLEPRFLKARENLSPHHCVSCHNEHKGQRVTLSEIGYCLNCHKQTKLRKDPLDVPHDRLIALNRWESCLGCHDFHGNHIMKTPKTVEQIIPAEKIQAYFQGGPSPYGDERRYTAKKEINHDE
ncbi:MAG: cytochrome c3 family protein [Methylococcaceae bacterium]|nr:cytochrome c3 family protein [Methylococcaceae bacterium]MDZ4155296.1 cytochrome c3 family protein [Methylococcales bacterium]MDP2393908.1 cytochrome c3 family protein [Methylococcaceae bacterium]MDP3018105.1 cytochrome c3 family protein [Methylococcaceae bacterium]MDP3391785.1 cytochrome c3 family protein [Methylococcaceae bacterium]